MYISNLTRVKPRGIASFKYIIICVTLYVCLYTYKGCWFHIKIKFRNCTIALIILYQTKEAFNDIYSE